MNADTLRRALDGGRDLARRLIERADRLHPAALVVLVAVLLAVGYGAGVVLVAAAMAVVTAVAALLKAAAVVIAGWLLLRLVYRGAVRWSAGRAGPVTT
ncbi:hypothetical protein [Streptomyces yangpuensis]|uniref:hypothetical protein n=1 Tax=Streptomyces yangpuensis TaxID=1648182 RepID=UPI000A778496|nr:hypothetical protein [Streptomyces yangpuensis]